MLFLRSLSAEHNFYGQLAEEELGVAIGSPAEPYKPERTRLPPSTGCREFNGRLPCIV